MRRAFAAVVVAILLGAMPAWAADESDAADVRQINPRYLLVDAKGRAVTNEDFPGRFQLLTFGYTFCPDVCPTTLTVMTMVLGQLGDKAAHLQPIFISVDPERDTGEIVDRYTKFFDPRILGLTGSPALVRAAADHYKVTYQKYSEPGAAPGTYSVDHSAGMYLLGPDGGFVAKFAYTASPQEVATRIGEFIAASGLPERSAGRR